MVSPLNYCLNTIWHDMINNDKIKIKKSIVGLSNVHIIYKKPFSYFLIVQLGTLVKQITKYINTHYERIKMTSIQRLAYKV